VAVPSKLYGILASGKPVIAQVPEGSEVAFTVREERCGVAVPHGDAGAVAEAVRRLAGDPEEARLMCARARGAYARRFTLERAAAAFLGIWRVVEARSG
jgi:colanic acid biosynthesis glycosyl transferase WcaI